MPPPGEMPVPSHWERSGLSNFAGTVRFERTFSAPQLAEGESLWLVCRGVDYFATILINGRHAGSHEGYFQTWAVEITPYLLPGENDLAIEVTCPREEPGAVWPDRKRLIKGVISHWDCRPGSWDPATGQDIHSGGIWGDVLLEVRPPVYIDRVAIQTKLTPPNEALAQTFLAQHEVAGVPPVARVSVTAEVVRGSASAGAGPYWLEIRIGSQATRLQISLDAGPITRVDALLTIPQPALWWTWDHGEPTLHPCTVTLARGDAEIDRYERMVGLREITVDPETGAWTLNGRRIFVRGTNIVPTLWLGEYGEQQITQDIALLKAAHVDGVRICVHVNREELYDALDRAGILVWQDFALQWGYQQSDAFIAEAIRQVKDMVRQLRHHPCIALWCCQNESTQFNREVLDPLLAQAAREEDSSRYVRPTSEFAEHLYPGWYAGHLRDYLRPPASPIISEFGAQALPSVEEVTEMAGPAWPPDRARLAYHDFQYDQTFNVAGIDMGASWQEFVAASQAYQANLLKVAIEHFRKAKYRPVGSIFQFMFMDCWPSVTWSVLSYARRPKAGYATLQRAYQAVLVGADFARDTWILYADAGSLLRGVALSPWVVNDRAVAYGDATITVTLHHAGSGRTAPVAETRCGVPADGVTMLPRLTLAIPEDWPTGDSTVALRLSQAGTTLSANEYLLHLIARPAGIGQA